MFDEQKPSEQELAAELVALEQQLRGLTPAPPRIDRDRLMFAAGVAAANEPGQVGRPIIIAGPSKAERPWIRHRFWPAAAATMTAATLLLSTMLVWQNRSQSVAQLKSNPQSATEVVNVPPATDAGQFDHVAARAAWSTIPPASSGYLGIRYIALTRDVGDSNSDFQSLSGDHDRHVEDYRTEPATAHELLDEFLRVPSRHNHSRS